VRRDDVRLGGPPVINGAIDAEGARTLSRLGGLSGLIALVVSWYCFRSVRLTVLVFATGMFCAGASLALLWATGTPMNAILLMMPPLVYVAVMSGAIHLVNYYLEALPDVGPQRAPARAVAHARLPLVLAATTTAIGLLSLCYSELLPIRQFGIYSACGVVMGTATLLLFLPSALQLFPATPQDSPAAGAGEAHDDGLMTLSRGWLAVADFVVRRRRWIVAGSLAAVLACGWGLTRLQTTIKVEKFFADGSKVLEDYDWIQSRLGGLVPMEVVLRVRDDSSLQLIDQVRLVDILQDRLMQLPEVSSTQSAATFSPPPTSRGVIGRIATNRWLRNALSELKDTGYLRTADGEKLWRISIRIPTADEIDFTEFVGAIRGQIDPVLAKLQEKGTTGVSAEYTGMVPVFNKAQHSLLDGMLFGFSTDLVLIVLAMVVLLRHWSVGVVILATSLFPATLIFGAMSWLGIPVDVGSVMTPSIALGVTVDDVAHFLLWFRRGVGQGMSQSQAVKLAYRGCAKPMYQSWAVIGLGLSVFALSTFVPALRFGVLMIGLLSLGLIGNLVLMPALLAGPLGGIFARSIRRSATASDARVTMEPSAELTAAAGS
jgi:predicted RND superfamily exporter protein